MEKAASSGGTRRRVHKGFSLGEVNSQTPLDRIARPEPGPIKVAHSKEICGGARTALSQQGAAPSSRLRPPRRERRAGPPRGSSGSRGLQPLIELSSPHPKLTVPIPGMRTNCCTRSATRAAPAEIIALRFSRLPRSASLVYTRGSLRSLLLRAKVPATALITVAAVARDGTCQSTPSVV
jgi:hypothetical protein